jgi:hypothetical protein
MWPTDPVACVVLVSSLIQKLLPLLISHLQDLDPYLIPPVHRRPPFKSTLDRLLELNSPAGVGLTLGKVVALLSHCECGRVMTKRSFRSHGCSTLEVIDLTLDD